MTILTVLKEPHPTLRKVAEPIDEVTAEIKQLAEDMLETMYEEWGVGIAAPQVGVSKRLIVVDTAHRGPTKAPRVFVNPNIVEAADSNIAYPEGCLSVPGVSADIERPSTIKLEWVDFEGATQTETFTGFDAVVIQHELDHLQGRLFIDHLSRQRRRMIQKKLQKMKKFSSV